MTASSLSRAPEEAAVIGVAWESPGSCPDWSATCTSFDRVYFGISRAEAELIDPHQRRLLHVAFSAIGHSGRTADDIAGTRCAVVVCAPSAPHLTLSDRLPPTGRSSGLAYVGSLRANAAGRLAYLFDLRGPAMVVDSGTTSFLTALRLAHTMLASRDVELALVCGASFPHDGSPGSDDGDEITGCVVLERPSDAARDGDPVQFVISSDYLDGLAVKLTGAPDGDRSAVSDRGLMSAGVALLNDLDPASVRRNGSSPRSFPVANGAAIAPPWLFTLSARTPVGLARYREQLREQVDGSWQPEDLQALSDTLLFGREQFEHRIAFLASDAETVVGGLGDPAPPPPRRPGVAPIVLIVGDGADGATDLPESIHLFPSVTRAMREQLRAPPADADNPRHQQLVWLVAMQGALARFGVLPSLTLTHGLGAHAARVWRGEATLAEALVAVTAGPSPAPPDGTRLRSALSEQTPNALLIDLTPGAAVSKIVDAHAPFSRSCRVRRGRHEADDCTAMLAALFVHGQTLDYRAGFERGPSRRVAVATPPLNEDPCALAEPLVSDEAPSLSSDLPQSTDDIVLSAVRHLLGEADVTLEDDFFGRGGNSINGMALTTALAERLGCDVDIEDLFETPSLEALAELIDERLAGGAAPTDGTDAFETGPLSIEQQSQLAATGPHPSLTLLLDDRIDVDNLGERLNDLLHRTPTLRAAVVRTAEGLCGTILSEVSVKVASHSCELTAVASDDPQAIDFVLTVLDRVDRTLPMPGALLRCDVLRVRFRDVERHILRFVAHGAFFDDASWPVVLDALSPAPAHYPPPDVPPDPWRHARTQREQTSAEAVDWARGFWARKLSRAQVGIDLSQLGTQPALRSAGLVLEASSLVRLRQLAAGHGMAMDWVLLGAWLVALAQAGAQTDLTVDVSISNRTARDRNTIAYLASTVPVWITIDPLSASCDLLGRVRHAVREALIHSGPADSWRAPEAPEGRLPLLFEITDVSRLDQVHPIGDALVTGRRIDRVPALFWSGLALRLEAQSDRITGTVNGVSADAADELERLFCECLETWTATT